MAANAAGAAAISSMPVDARSPNFRIDQDQLAVVERKEREDRALGGGITASWTGHATEPFASLPEDKRKLLAQSQLDHPPKFEPPELQTPPRPFPPFTASRLLTIPAQANAIVRKLLPSLASLATVEMRLSEPQRALLLRALQAMPTPKKMEDAKAIFDLMESLR